MWLALLPLFIGAEQNLKEVYAGMTETRTSLTFSSYCAGKKSAFACSHLVIANDATLLVDAQPDERNAKKLIALANGVGKPVTHIVLTSVSPHHTGGLAALREAFPNAVITTSAKVAAEAKTTAGLEAVPIERLGPSFEFGKERVLVREVPFGASTVATLFFAQLFTLVSGDVIADLDPQDAPPTKQWSAALTAAVKDRTIKRVLVGHGDSGGAERVEAMRAQLQERKN